MAKLLFSIHEKRLIDALLKINDSRDRFRLLNSKESLSFQQILIICSNAWKCHPRALLGKGNPRSQTDRGRKASLLMGLYFFSNLETSEVIKKVGWDCSFRFERCYGWFNHIVAETNRYAGIQAQIISQLDKECPQRLRLSTARRLARDLNDVPLVCYACKWRRGCKYAQSFSLRMTNCSIIKIGLTYGIVKETNGPRSQVRMTEMVNYLIKGIESTKEERTVN